VIRHDAARARRLLPDHRSGAKPRRVRGIFLALVAVCPQVPVLAVAAEIDFTRHLVRVESAAGQHPGPDVGPARPFFGVAGPARVIVTARSGEPVVTVRLNGVDVLDGQALRQTTSLEIPVELAEANTIAVGLDGRDGAAASVRVKQRADVALNVISWVHFNTNVSDFNEARAFYGVLGFETMSGFPDTNTLAMAHALGIQTPTAYDGSLGEEAGGYLLHGELVGPDGFWGGVIDLIEFTIPRNEEPPYPGLNHLGMARALMHTGDIAAAYDQLVGAGVNFLSPPATRSDGTRFAVLTDPDGTFYELVELEGPGGEASEKPVIGLGRVNVNVSDFERSEAWYRMFGYVATRKLPPTDSAEVAAAMGFDAPYRIDGAVLSHEVDGSQIELVQWLSPFDPEPAYPPPVSHLGIHRMALLTGDIEADVAALKAQGVKFISGITPCCSGPDSWGSIVLFYDPDGTVVELVEQPFMGTVARAVIWLRRLFE
jgi:catechol 2,3-dioxygenase-like lactoylglutathione lyase family enzyme